MRAFKEHRKRLACLILFHVVLAETKSHFTYEKRAHDELALVPEVLDKNERNRANKYACQHTSMVN